MARKRLAIVGFSRNPTDFSRRLFAEFQKRGYDMVPVTPHAAEIDGTHCFGRVQDVQPPVEGAILLTNPAATEQVVRDCVEAGVQRVWMFRAGGAGSVSPAALVFCQLNGIEVVGGECPFMFLPQTGAVHRIHGWVRRMVGKYPG